MNKTRLVFWGENQSALQRMDLKSPGKITSCLDQKGQRLGGSEGRCLDKIVPIDFKKSERTGWLISCRKWGGGVRGVSLRSLVYLYFRHQVQHTPSLSHPWKDSAEAPWGSLHLMLHCGGHRSVKQPARMGERERKGPGENQQKLLLGSYSTVGMLEDRRKEQLSISAERSRELRLCVFWT